MRQRSGWKQYAATAGFAQGKPTASYPQTIAALELWARDNAKDDLRGYKSPLVSMEHYGCRIDPEFGSWEQMNEMSDRTNAAVQNLPVEFREVIQVHYLHKLVLGERIVPIHRSLDVKERAKRYLNMTKREYYDRLADAHAKIAYWLGMDGS